MIEGGLARHVRKLAEALVRQGLSWMCSRAARARGDGVDAKSVGV